MGFAVCHIEKVKSGSSPLGRHIDREEGQEHTYRNADPARKKENVDLTPALWRGLPLAEAIKGRIAEGYASKRAIRSDAVRAMSIVLTGTHEDMKKIFASPTGRKSWIEANKAFIAKEFDAENVVKFTLHLDERTPHLHAVVVPLTKDGRLSAKERMGNAQQLSDLQTRYGELMQPLALDRGVVGSKAIHNREGWYTGKVKEKEAQLSPLPEFKLADRLNPAPYIERVTERVNEASQAMVDAQLEARRRAQQERAAQREIKTVKEKLTLASAMVKKMEALYTLVMAKLLGWKVKPELDTKLEAMKKEFVERHRPEDKKADQKEEIKPENQQNRSRGPRR